MTTLENVEKLRERANVTYEQAKEALNASGGDLLDAMIYLESKGVIGTPPGGGCYSSSTQAPPKQETYTGHSATHPNDKTFGWWTDRFLRFCRMLIQKGTQNIFEVWEDGEIWFSMPVILLVILLIIGFWIAIPLLVIGLFCGYSYRFSGRDVELTPVNKVMNSASNAAESLKEEIRTSRNTPPNE